MIPKQGERRRFEMQFRHKKHRKRLSKMRDMQIRNSNRITEIALRKLNKETKKMQKFKQK